MCEKILSDLRAFVGHFQGSCFTIIYVRIIGFAYGCDFVNYIGDMGPFKFMICINAFYSMYFAFSVIMQLVI